MRSAGEPSGSRRRSTVSKPCTLCGVNPRHVETKPPHKGTTLVWCEPCLEKLAEECAALAKVEP